MNYPAANNGISKRRQQHRNHSEASFGVSTRGAMKRLVLVLGCIAVLICLASGPALANKSTVSIEAPASAEKDSEVVIRLKVTHNGNSYFHYTNRLKVEVDGKQVALWDFTSGNRPEDATFTREVKIRVGANTEVIADATCNVHGSAGPAKATILVGGTGTKP